MPHPSFGFCAHGVYPDLSRLVGTTLVGASRKVLRGKGARCVPRSTPIPVARTARQGLTACHLPRFLMAAVPLIW